MPRPTDIDSVRRNIREIVESPHAAALTAAYFDADGGFAGALFDGLDPSGMLADNPRDHFVVDDILAASLLDVRYGPTAVRTLLGSAPLHEALRAVTLDRPLWEASTADLDGAILLWRLVRQIDGVGRTRASKLLARKRPHLVPIVDSVIAKALDLGDESWIPLSVVLRDGQLRETIEALRPTHVSTRISILRLLDVVAWMTRSRSTSAVAVQVAVGATPARSLTAPRRSTG
ncbi:hypothetical protein GCM10028777_02170 [Angustibacter speluncae]